MVSKLDFEGAIDSAAVLDAFKSEMSTLEIVTDQMVERLEAMRRRINKARSALSRDARMLSSISVPGVPEGLAQLAHFADRYRALTDGQWARLVQLALALKDDGAEPREGK
jgi:methyl-accepting chemotaxis protein